MITPDKISTAIAAYPPYMRQKDIAELLVALLGVGSASSVRTMTDRGDLPQPLRLNRRSTLYERDGVRDALVAKLCPSAN